MLKLYYTTTAGEDQVQPKSYRSLGGYKSSSLVKNDDFDNFFGEITNYTISQNNQNQYIGVILKNEGTALTNILFYFTTASDSYSEWEIAAVDLATDGDGVKFMENIPTIHSMPTSASFNKAEGFGNAVDLGDLAQDEKIGLWFKRIILVDKAKADKADLTEEDPENENRVVEKEKAKSDTIEMTFSYD